MQRPKINRVWSGNSPMQRRDPGDAKYQQGWVSEIPTYQVLNYLQYKVDTTILAQAERGIPEWGTDVSYGLGSIVWDNKTGYIYVATVQQPDRTKAPSDNAPHWSRSSIQITRKEFDDIVVAIQAHINNKSNPHNLTAAQLNAYNKQEMDNLVSQYRALVSAHVNDKNNPHETTAAQAGGVPITGGTYEGTVKFLKSILLNNEDTARLCNEDGLYLEIGPHNADVALIGITTAGDVVAGRGTSKSKVVTEVMFQDLKAGQEPRYAVPEPAFILPLVYDINIYKGAGEISSAVDPVYDSFGFLRRGGGLQQSLSGTVDVVPATDQYTVAADVVMEERVTTGDNWPLTIGLSGAYLGVNREGIAHFNNRVDIALSNGTAVAGVVNRLVATSRVVGSGVVEVCLYLNGVQVAKKTGATMSTPRNMRVTFAGDANVRRVGGGNLRVWPFCLTPEQVSTL